MFNDFKPTLYLIRGVSGSGKSTLAELMFSSDMVGYTAEADCYFIDDKGNYNFDASKLPEAHRICYEATEWVLKHSKSSIAVSNTSTTEKEVKKYQDLANECGANFVSIIVENRNDTKDIHGLSQEVLTKQRNRFSIKL